MDLADEQATIELGKRLADCLKTSCNIYLEGDLGAGKTTLVRAILKAMGHAGSVKSPTYTLVETYDLGNLQVAHMDLYRLADPEELEFIGIRDLMSGENSVCLIEWPDKGVGVLPDPDVNITLKYKENGRDVVFQATSDTGKSLMNCLGLS